MSPKLKKALTLIAAAAFLAVSFAFDPGPEPLQARSPKAVQGSGR